MSQRSQTQQAITNLDTLVKQNGALVEQLSSGAKEATIGSATDSAAETTGSTLFAWVKKVRDYLYGIVTTSPYAKEATLGSPSDASSAATVFGKIAGVAGAIPTVQAIQSGLAKTSELPTDYAKQGSGQNTLTDIYSLIGYTISEIDAV